MASGGAGGVHARGWGGRGRGGSTLGERASLSFMLQQHICSLPTHSTNAPGAAEAQRAESHGWPGL